MTSLPGLKHEASKEACRQIILVVEDDQSIRELLSVCIETETSYRVLSMESGEDTLQSIEEVKAAHPRLFILDYLLPTMTAFDLYDRLHRHKELAQVPALIITAASTDLRIDGEVAERGLTLLTKPFDIDDLLERIEQGILHHPQPLHSGQ